MRKQTVSIELELYRVTLSAVRPVYGWARSTELAYQHWEATVYGHFCRFGSTQFIGQFELTGVYGAAEYSVANSEVLSMKLYDPRLKAFTATGRQEQDYLFPFPDYVMRIASQPGTGLARCIEKTVIGQLQRHGTMEQVFELLAPCSPIDPALEENGRNPGPDIQDTGYQ